MNTIWITGGSSGMGKAMAKKYKQEGWNVAVSGRNQERLDETLHELDQIERGNKQRTWVELPYPISFR